MKLWLVVAFFTLSSAHAMSCDQPLGSHLYARFLVEEIAPDGADLVKSVPEFKKGQIIELFGPIETSRMKIGSLEISGNDHLSSSPLDGLPSLSNPLDGRGVVAPLESVLFVVNDQVLSMEVPRYFDKLPPNHVVWIATYKTPWVHLIKLVSQ